MQHSVLDIDLPFRSLVYFKGPRDGASDAVHSHKASAFDMLGTRLKNQFSLRSVPLSKTCKLGIKQKQVIEFDFGYQREGHLKQVAGFFFKTIFALQRPTP